MDRLTRIEFLKRERLVIVHDAALREHAEFRRVLRVRNLDDEIWLVRTDSFRPMGNSPGRYIDHGVVDELSLYKPLKAFRDFNERGVLVQTVGWKDQP
jgi:hypothetical protein